MGGVSSDTYRLSKQVGDLQVKACHIYYGGHAMCTRRADGAH